MADYVDNKRLTKELGEWANTARHEIENGLCRSRMPEYIGECIYLICNNMSFKSSFINYTYKEEMIGNAIENCLRYVKNYKPDRGNAFGYISTIAYYAFIRKIKKENKRHIDHLVFVRKTFSEDSINDIINTDNPNDIKGYDTYINHMQSILDDMNIEIPEKKKAKKKLNSNVTDIMKGEAY